MSVIRAAAILTALISTVAAHGRVQGVVVDGVYYEGYNPSFQFSSNPPVVIGWSCPECLDNGFVAPDAYASSNITCHKNATPGGTHATVKAGGTVELQWTAWPSSHHGPVLDYLANCNGPCETVDKTGLEFFKIDAGGLVDYAALPGTWASDQLIANNNSWVVKIPETIAPGNYVLRHEIIALHSANNADGAQNYPQCINLEVTGSGTDSPAGTLGTALYKESDPGILVNIYQTFSTYDIPGPTLYSGAISVSQSAIAITGAATASSAAKSTLADITTLPVSSATPTVTSSSAISTSSLVSSAVSGGTPTTSAAIRVSSTPSAPELATSTKTIDTTQVITTEVYVTVTGAAPTSDSSSPAMSAIANLATALPSELLTSALPTALPTSAGNTSGTVPTLPAGTTFQDLVDWISYILNSYFKESRNQSKHPRNFSPLVRRA